MEVVRKSYPKSARTRRCQPWGGTRCAELRAELERQGVLEEFGVTMIGATADAIDKAEDRRRFHVAMKKIGLETARSGIAHDGSKSAGVAADVGFPVHYSPILYHGR